MNWFYALNNQQTGPVSDDELVRLVQTGVISGQTLIWHSGLANWQTYDAVRAAAGVGAAPAAVLEPGLTACSQCSRAFPDDEIVRVSGYDTCAACKPVLIEKLRQGLLSGSGSGSARPFAGFGIRLGAAILDGVILIPVFIVVYVGYFFLFRSSFTPPQANTPPDLHSVLMTQAWGMLFGLGLAVVQGAYSAFCVSRFGGTPGKRICELRVVRGGGGPVTFWRAYARYGAKTLCRLIPLIGILIDTMFIWFDPEKRALHDQMCDTRVILDPRAARTVLAAPPVEKLVEG